MKQPESLIAIGLSGASRYQQLPPPPHAVLADVWSRIDESNLPQAVLHASALDGLARRSGYQPMTDIALSDPAREETKVQIQDAAVVAAQRMIRGEFTHGWTEWLRLCQRHGFIAAPRLLPALLDLGTQQRNLRPLIRAVVGERGFWIARKLESWSWVLEAADVLDEAWEVGEPAERIAWLCQERECNIARAIQALEETWPSESGEMRESITRIAAECPRPEDEIWLQKLALKDRRQSVRQAAVRALLQLPQSAFADRARARLLKLIRLKRHLTLDIPDTYDDVWEQDGIQIKAPGNYGQKAWWARQILAQNPITSWAEALDLGIPDLVELKIDEDWRELVYDAWIDSAQQVPSESFLIHFLPKKLRGKKVMRASDCYVSQLPSLFGVLPVEAVARVLESIQIEAPLTLDLLARFKPEVGAAHRHLNKVIRSWLREKRSEANRSTAESLAYCVAPEAFKPLLLDIASMPSLSSAAETFARTLEFRQSYIPHLNRSPS